MKTLFPLSGAQRNDGKVSWLLQFAMQWIHWPTYTCLWIYN